MESLAQGGAEVTLCVRWQLSEIEGGRVRAPGDVRQHQQAMDPLVIDTPATITARDLSSHFRQPRQQERRDLVELLVEDRCPPETDQIRSALSIPPPGDTSTTASAGTRHERTLPPAREPAQRDFPPSVRVLRGRTVSIS